MIIYCLLLSILITASIANQPETLEQYSEPYAANWTSLDTRPLPLWFDDAKIGIFLHWGVFSVPSFHSEWFWSMWKDSKSPDIVKFMDKNYPPGYSYQEFAKDFHAEFYNPDEWAELFKKSGARYVVLTSKHHEGFTLWPSEYSFGWNAMDVGPHRDILGDLANSVRAQNLTFGLYHSLYEWYNPIYLQDKKKQFSTQYFVDNKILPELIELVNKYKPSVIWSDGDWEARDVYWKSTEFLAWLYNESPVRDTVVVNDRWGIDIPCKHGDFYSCQDRYNPGTLQPHKWENAMTLDKVSWGFRRNANITDYLTIDELLKTLSMTISCGGNLLMNIGPTKEGTIAPIFQERLLQLGKWLDINGEAIYGSKPWKVQNDSLASDVWYTSNKNDKIVYGIVLFWPKDELLTLGSLNKFLIPEQSIVTILGNENIKLMWKLGNNVVSIKFPGKGIIASQNAWVLKIIK